MNQLQPWDLRDLCDRQRTYWNAYQSLSNAEILRVRGRLSILEIIQEAFATRIASTADVSRRTETLLDRLAEEKYRRIVAAKQDSALSAQSVGVLLQIHEMVPWIWQLRSVRWRNTNQKYRHLFRVYQRRDRGKRPSWNDSQRPTLFQEIAIVQVPLAKESPKSAWELTKEQPFQWRQRSEVRWFFDQCIRGATYGDVVVSLLSGQPWYVDELQGITGTDFGKVNHSLVLRQALCGCEILQKGGEDEEAVRQFFAYLNLEPQRVGERYHLSYPQFELLRTLDSELVPACPWYHEEEGNCV